MRAVLALLCLAALVAGCGGDDDETTVTETTTVVETQTTPAPVEPDETTQTPPPGEQPPANGHGGAQAADECGSLAFEENTDSGAINIAAVGIDCPTARAVARAAEGHAGELAYEAEDFTCTGARTNGPGLASIEWVCIGVDREVVTFATS